MKPTIKCPYCKSNSDIVEDALKGFYCRECGKHFENYMKYKPGTYIMGRCSVTVAKTPAGHWQIAIQCKDSMPSYKEIVQARYKYLPDDLVMVQAFPPKRELKTFPANTHILFELVNG
jgi:hypothetical protein